MDLDALLADLARPGELVGFRDDALTRELLVALVTALDAPIVRPTG